MSKFSTNGKWCENTHDQAGNRSSVLEADGTTHAYGYDAKYQLTDWMRKNGKGKKEYHFKYTYDAAGNRTRLQKQTFGKAKSSVATSGRRGNNPKADDWWDHPSHSYAYDAANQLTEIGLGESAGKGKSWAVRFEYDANGNQIAKTDRNGKTTFEYDYNNMIKHITFPDSNENTYHNSTEGLKRPVKIDSTGYVGNFYDDYQGVEHILWEYDEQGQPKTRYTLGPRPDEIISRTTSDGTTSYYHYDGLGSVVALTDENGNVIGRYEYAPFGKMLSQPDGIDNKFTFQGREYDRDSGLYYYRTRYLDPEIGRFISRDPIGDIANPVSRRVRTEAMTVLYQMAMLQLILADNETLSTADRMGLVAGAVADLKLAGVVASGDPIFAIYIGGLNQYVFCGDNPVNFRDPLGLCGDGTSIRSMTGRESFRSWWSRNVQYPTYRVVEAVTWVFNPLDIPDFSEAGFQQQRYDALHYQGPVIGVPPSIMFRQVKPAQIDPSLIRKAKELFKNQTQPRLRSIVSEPPTIDMDTAPKGFWRNAFKAIGELLDNYMGEGPPPQ